MTASVADITSEVSKDEQSIMGHCLSRLIATKPHFMQKNSTDLMQNELRSQGSQDADILRASPDLAI